MQPITQGKYVIAYKGCNHFPIGYVIAIHFDKLPYGFLWADGQYVNVQSYSLLYSVIGDSFCPRRISRKTTFWERLQFWKYGDYIEFDNPEYRNGFFRLPALNSYPLQTLEKAQHEKNKMLADRCDELPINNYL